MSAPAAAAALLAADEDDEPAADFSDADNSAYVALLLEDI